MQARRVESSLHNDRLSSMKKDLYIPLSIPCLFWIQLLFVLLSLYRNTVVAIVDTQKWQFVTVSKKICNGILRKSLILEQYHFSQFAFLIFIYSSLFTQSEFLIFKIYFFCFTLFNNFITALLQVMKILVRIVANQL